jgi:DNA-directed RNA polymerase subunit RPC12/RpoP
MTIRCECDHCGASLKVKDKLAGTAGKCPKCGEKILIPNVSDGDSEDVLLSDDDEKVSRSDTPAKSAAEAEEDAIFGDDFFSIQEPEPRPRYVAPVITEDDEEDEPQPREKKKSKSAESRIGAEVETGSGANAASIASSLLSKTGKRNRPEDFKDPAIPEKVSYDFSEINYLLLQRILPAVGAAIVVFFLANWMFSGVMGGGSELPELAELTGRVTNSGEGVAASLRFSPEPGNSGDGGFSGSSSTAFCEADGSYEAFYNDDVEGLVIGKHQVHIQFGTLRVTREITVEAGSQVIDFELAE